MSAESIQWHLECWANSAESLLKAEQELARLAQSVKEQQERHLFYRRQIDTAVSEGKAAFDSDRYLAKRRSELVGVPL